MSVTTAGGTSAALDLNELLPAGTGSLGDVALSPAGALWVMDSANPGHVLRLDAASGQVLQSIVLTDADYGSTYAANYAGLQVLPQAMSLGATSVPAGSLLVFNGYAYFDRVTAVDPTSGATLASLALPQNPDLTAGLYDPASGHLFVLSYGTNQMVEIDPATGATLASLAVPINVQGWAGIALDPSGNGLWLAGTGAGSLLVEVDRTGKELRRLDLASQGVDQAEISGLAFAADGSLRVASTQGVVYRVSVDFDLSVKTATLAQVLASATDGVAAQGALASANVGQVITLVGSNFGPGTQVLFNTRDNAGNAGLVGVRPLAIDAAGTRLQVLVPDLATTGDIRVTNIGTANLGFNYYNDAVYRQVTRSFVAGGIERRRALRRRRPARRRRRELGHRQRRRAPGRGGGLLRHLRRRRQGRLEQPHHRPLVEGELQRVLRALQQHQPGAEPLRARSRPDLHALLRPLRHRQLGRQRHLQRPRRVRRLGRRGEPAARQPQQHLAGQRADAQRQRGHPAADRADPQRAELRAPGAGHVLLSQRLGLHGGRQHRHHRRRGARRPGQQRLAVRRHRQRATTPSASSPRSTLDGPIRITTEGGYAQIAAPAFGAQPVVAFTGIATSAASGAAADAALASANTGQQIVLTGQGFTSQTLVQFQGLDDSGRAGLITRSGSASNGGTMLTVQVPALARSGAVTVLGSGASFALQIVPTLRSLGGTVAAGNTLVLEGSGLTASDLQVQIGGVGVGSFTVRTVYDATSSSADQQILTLTVPAGVAGGPVTVSTAGGSASLRTGVTVTALSDLTPAAEVGDTLASAQALVLGANQSLKVNSDIGGARGALDVDLYRVTLAAGEQLTLNMVNGGSLYSYLRVFDAAGKPLLTTPYFNPGSSNTAQPFVAPAAGSYFIGVSGYNNTTYDPKVAGSGANASYSGSYTLALERREAGAVRLSAITASAASGTPANAGIASANTGQTITLAGSGLVAGDQVVFSALDSNGRLYEQSVTPASIAADGASLTVAVPINAATGHVRLARDSAGLLLQIVPTLSDVTMNAGGAFTGGSLTLTGTGFAEGASTVLFGAQRLDDLSRNYGLDVNSFNNTSLFLTVPEGVPTGPIRVSTIGGTSAAFGLSLTGITATADSGTAAGGGAAANPGQVITLVGAGFDTSLDIVFQTIDANGTRSDRVVRPGTVNAGGTQVQVTVPLDAVTGSVRLVGDGSGASVALQIVPVVTDVQVQSVSSDGSSAVVILTGVGFVEGNNSEYRFGSGAGGVVLLDAGAATGPDVGQFYDYTSNRYVTGVQMTVPLSDGAFGPITVRTAGGTSAAYSVSLSGITATALSGTPADAAQASANPGQAITLVGSGLTTASDVLLRWRNINGDAQMTQLSPTAAAADGTSATLVIPVYANGAYTLQLFGSAGQPLLQIVPKLERYDQQDRLVLFGSGFVEGASTYHFAGFDAVDTPADANHIDVYYDGEQNRSAYLDRTALPSHGLGAVSVTTAGGTSAALDLNELLPVGTGSLGDVALSPAGALWVMDSANPGHVLRLDAASGQVLQSIVLTDADYGSTYAANYAGLQVLPQAMSLGATSVPAGSLLVFNGYAYFDRVTAVDPTSGATLASLALPQNPDLTAGLYDPASGHLFVLSYGTNQMVEIDPATGATLASLAVPINVQGWAGIALDPSGNGLWLAGTGAGSLLVEVDRTGKELRRLDLASQGVDQAEISGLAFAADGSLRVASTQGVVYRVTV